ncbi:MAG: hypothetical protein WC989_04030 [Micavibrio sp.]
MVYRHKPEAPSLKDAADGSFDTSTRLTNGMMEDRQIAWEEKLLEKHNGDAAKAAIDQIFGCDL